MTVSGCSSGNKEPNQDNLRPEMRESFVNYLATVVKHFQDAEGIHFESVEPFNEPDGDWWKAGGKQEGYTVPVATQNAILPMLASRLKHDGVNTFVAGVDTNNISAAVSVGGHPHQRLQDISAAFRMSSSGKRGRFNLSRSPSMPFLRCIF